MHSLLLISAPGAGKGMISKYLKQKYNFVSISMGNLLREKLKEDRTVSEIIKSGGFVDNDIVYDLFEDIIKENQNSNLIFDGFPRRLDQIDNFEKIMDKYGIILDMVIYIDTNEEIVKKRITGRLLCSDCNEVYNKYLDKIENNKCKFCNGDLIKRDDDKMATYELRYKAFAKETLPLIDYYKKKNILYKVSNNESIEKTYNQVDMLVKKGWNNDYN